MGSPDNEKDRYRNEGLQHVVTIGWRLTVGKLHVTRDQCAAFVAERQHEPPGDARGAIPALRKEGSHPVVCVNWDDANAYVIWLDRTLTLEPCLIPSGCIIFDVPTHQR
jgi:formylglycine-generating enzyme required for sulfatase activity